MTTKTEVQAQPTETTRDLPVLTPATDIYETEREIVVVLDMPGVDDQHVEVTLENNELALSGRTDAAPPAAELLYWEFGPVEYRRTFALAEDVEREKITAKVKHGVLRVVLPKAAKAEPRRIAVQADA